MGGLRSVQVLEVPLKGHGLSPGLTPFLRVETKTSPTYSGLGSGSWV